MTLSMACSRCFSPTEGFGWRAAIRAASLQTLEISAPVKPGVRATSFLARGAGAGRHGGAARAAAVHRDHLRGACGGHGRPGGGHGPSRGSVGLAWGERCKRAQPSASAGRAALGAPRKQIKAHVTRSNGTPLQYSCLENPTDGGAWWAAVHGVAKSQTRLSNFTFTFHFHTLEKEMATHSSVLAWRIPGMGSLVGCRLWGCTESDTTEATQQ